MATTTFLGIESSCDDTAAAVVRLGPDGAEVLSSVVEGQAALHADFGGVVPEIAARAHAEKLDACVEEALAQAGLTLADLDRIEFMEAFAVTIAKFLRDRGADPARVNVSGGHLAKGHPLGASGAILTSTLLDALDACGGKYGLVVLTGAMGVGAAMIVERQ